MRFLRRSFEPFHCLFGCWFRNDFATFVNQSFLKPTSKRLHRIRVASFGCCPHATKETLPASPIGLHRNLCVKR
jgi:hypothetical protein